MKYSPFPYKLSSDDLIEDGILFNAPIFCKNRTKDERCKEFYKSLKNKDGFYKCPHGFGVQVFSIAEKQFITTCLNIEKITDRKILKLIKSNEFLPRLTQEKYYQLKNEYHEIILESLSLKEREAMLDLKDEKNAKEKKLLENTLHDIRKLNNELKNFIEQFSIEIQSITACNSRLSTLSTDIFSVANLLSIRFDSYDFEVNPDLNANALKYSVAVYKKVEKVYKCLNNRLRPKKLKVHLEGKSYNLFYTSNIIEIGLFIIIDNAIKYAPDDSDIIIMFTEKDNELCLSFKNWGIRPLDDEMNKLTSREFRSRAVVDSQKYEGRGIGLYLLNCICNYCGIDLNIKRGDDMKWILGDKYSPFIVELKFKNMIVPREMIE